MRWKGNVAKDIGWEQFTDKVISVISEDQEKIVFVLWGSHAQSKIPLINAKHIIIKSHFYLHYQERSIYSLEADLLAESIKTLRKILFGNS